MHNFEFYIAHEYENPTHLFFYRPIRLTTNLLKAKILNDYKIDFDKTYQFYLNLGGLNFSFIGKPIRRDAPDEIVFLIQESRIELRKYPRLKTENLGIKVTVENLKGYLVDISLGGCKVKFENPIPEKFYMSSSYKILEIETPDGKVVKIPAYAVNVNTCLNTVSFAFLRKDEKVVKLYTKIGEYIKRLKEKFSYENGQSGESCPL
jgi:hypothetical protein